MSSLHYYYSKVFALCHECRFCNVLYIQTMGKICLPTNTEIKVKKKKKSMIKRKPRVRN